jgi:hypothetical protein
MSNPTSFDATGNNDLRAYFAWQKALWGDPTLRKLAGKSNLDIRATAQVIALHGHNGHGCCVGMPTVAEMIGCNEQTIRVHCDELVSLGWLTRVRRPGRTTVFRIANPVANPVGQTADPVGQTVSGTANPVGPDPRGSGAERVGGTGNPVGLEHRGTPWVQTHDDQNSNQNKTGGSPLAPQRQTRDGGRPADRRPEQDRPRSLRDRGLTPPTTRAPSAQGTAPKIKSSPRTEVQEPKSKELDHPSGGREFQLHDQEMTRGENSVARRVISEGSGGVVPPGICARASGQTSTPPQPGGVARGGFDYGDHGDGADYDLAAALAFERSQAIRRARLEAGR